MKRFLIAAIALSIIGSTPVWAQSNAELAEKITAARAENAKKTVNYSWTKRTEVKVKGEVKSTVTELVRYDVDGEMQTTLISQDKAKAPKRIKGKIAKKKGGEMKDWMAELGEVLKAYSLPTEGNLLDFLNSATISPDGDGRKLDAEGVVQPGDRMSVWIGADHKMTKTEVSTQHDGSNVKLGTDHETTPDGLDYVARTTIVVPDKGVEMTVENFSYQPEQ